MNETTTRTNPLSQLEAECVAGGMINHRDAQEKMPSVNDIAKGASKYYLPEMQMDTGIIYLP